MARCPRCGYSKTGREKRVPLIRDYAGDFGTPDPAEMLDNVAWQCVICDTIVSEMTGKAKGMGGAIYGLAKFCACCQMTKPNTVHERVKVTEDDDPEEIADTEDVQMEWRCPFCETWNTGG